MLQALMCNKLAFGFEGTLTVTAQVTAILRFWLFWNYFSLSKEPARSDRNTVNLSQVMDYLIAAKDFVALQTRCKGAPRATQLMLVELLAVKNCINLPILIILTANLNPRRK